MAQTFREAIAQVAGEEFDAATGFTRPRYRGTAPRADIAAAWRRFDKREIQRVVGQITAIGGASPMDAADAVQDAFVVLLGSRPELFTEDPVQMLGLLSAYARKRLLKLREQQSGGGRRCLSLEVLSGTDGTSENPLASATSAVAHLRPGVDEEARYTPPPAPGEVWSRLQLIGAVQRFRDVHGRAPRGRDFAPENNLPDRAVVPRHGFSTLNDLLLEAGVPIEVATKTRQKWTAVASADACYSFRRRHGYWPNSEDARYLAAGTLPSSRAMEKYFGGWSALDVQLGTEDILGPIDRPTLVPDGSLTTRLLAEGHRTSGRQPISSERAQQLDVTSVGEGADAGVEGN